MLVDGDAVIYTPGEDQGVIAKDWRGSLASEGSDGWSLVFFRGDCDYQWSTPIRSVVPDEPGRRLGERWDTTMVRRLEWLHRRYPDPYC